LLQNIKVLGIDQDANQQNDKLKLVRAVTIEVTPQQARKLALAPKVGSMSLALRNNMVNVEPTPTRVIDLADLEIGEPHQIDGVWYRPFICPAILDLSGEICLRAFLTAR